MLAVLEAVPWLSASLSFRMTLLSSPSPCKQGLIPCFVSSPPQALVNIIKPPVRDPKGFLQLHIHRDLEHLAKTLGRSADESMSAVHVVLCGLLRGQQQRPDQCKGPGPGCLGTAAQRAGLLLTAPEGHRGMAGEGGAFTAVGSGPAISESLAQECSVRVYEGRLCSFKNQPSV